MMRVFKFKNRLLRELYFCCNLQRPGILTYIKYAAVLCNSLHVATTREFWKRSRVFHIFFSCVLCACSSNSPAPYEEKGEIKYVQNSNSVYMQSEPIENHRVLNGQHVAKSGQIVESELKPIPQLENDEVVLHNNSDVKKEDVKEEIHTVDARVLALESEVESRNVESDFKIKNPLGAKHFQWPIKGMISSRYGKNGNKFNEGIDIKYVSNDIVNAIGDGKVVYLAQNVEGYGNLIIIKHENDIMSAYAQLDQILVKRNDVVKRGQNIGKILATSEGMLHFSMRKGKKTIDPETIIK